MRDCGKTFEVDEDAPMNTIHALKDVFQELSSRGMSCVRIDEL
ncbi:hypothetical protein [Bacillus cereus group sp. BfR-BA-01380]|nr:hypothetical protein [Bacillus cereus group sp. BfR-BA-01380]